MAIQLERHLFTLEEYERMVEAGVFDEDARIELIRGEIVEMAAIGLRHATCVARLTTLLVQKSVAKAIVWPQGNPLWLLGHSRPEPDITLLRWRDDYYAAKRPTAEDVLLVVEVADTSLKYDRSVKGPLYAEASIPEYWLVNLQGNVIELYAGPAEGAYGRTAKAERGETLTLLTLPDLLQGVIEASDILPRTRDYELEG
jgi:Uma2 family endonuclease